MLQVVRSLHDNLLVVIFAVAVFNLERVRKNLLLAGLCLVH